MVEKTRDGSQYLLCADLKARSLNALIKPFLKHQPDSDRQRILFSTILMPGD
jgi:hypothetical protein